MTTLYLVTSLFLALVVTCIQGNASSKFILGLPSLVGCVIYGILAAKGFGLI